jgi:hypothetical protein
MLASFRISQTVDAATFTPVYKQFAVQAPVAPTGVLSGQAQDQGSDGADRARSASAPGPGSGGVPAGDQVTVPAQDRVRAHQQPHTSKYVLRGAVQDRCQERSIACCEADSLPVQLSLQYRDLMS